MQMVLDSSASVKSCRRILSEDDDLDLGDTSIIREDSPFASSVYARIDDVLIGKDDGLTTDEKSMVPAEASENSSKPSSNPRSRRVRGFFSGFAIPASSRREGEVSF